MEAILRGLLSSLIAGIQHVFAGGRLAQAHAGGNASEEEEEWFDASEDIDDSDASAGSWWEQSHIDPADVEAHLLKDIHGNGAALLSMMKCIDWLLTKSLIDTMVLCI